MTIDDAIRYNGATLDEMERQLLHHRAGALRLGIEALKREKERREYKAFRIPTLLPGETE
ncbi:unnamed protein product [marine sediment metagenome]|uniref:Uncharacterized protein n=1 Tax=marine sediment metagenome TaxID=412755 RepID=X1KJZ0_9ZZZZ